MKVSVQKLQRLSPKHPEYQEEGSYEPTGDPIEPPICQDYPLPGCPQAAIWLTPEIDGKRDITLVNQSQETITYILEYVQAEEPIYLSEIVEPESVSSTLHFWKSWKSAELTVIAYKLELENKDNNPPESCAIITYDATTQPSPDISSV